MVMATQVGIGERRTAEGRLSRALDQLYGQPAIHKAPADVVTLGAMIFEPTFLKILGLVAVGLDQPGHWIAQNAHALMLLDGGLF
jgi:hypothetical protein